MKSKFQETNRKLTLQVSLTIAALNEAIQEQVKQAGSFIKKFTPNPKRFSDDQYARLLSDKLECVYFSNVNMILLEEMEKPLDHQYSHTFNPYKRKQEEFERKLVCSTEDSKHENRVIDQYLRNIFEKNSHLTLRENFLIKLMEKSITPSGIEVGLMDSVFKEALNIKSYFDSELNFGQIIIATTINFDVVVRKFTENISEIALNEEAKKLVNIYTDLAGTIKALQPCTAGNKYVFNKEQEVAAALVEVDNIKNVDSLNQLFVLSELYVNKHKNPVRDFIFGMNKTKSWQSVAIKIRGNAYDCLLAEVERIEDIDDKIDYLRKAKLLPVFKDHRYNYIITGAFFRTATLKKIDGQIKGYLDQKKNEDFLLVKNDNANNLNT